MNNYTFISLYLTFLLFHLILKIIRDGYYSPSILLKIEYFKKIKIQKKYRKL